MKFSKEEKEIVKAMVQYENRGWNLASVLNHCRLLEKHGIGIVNADNADLVCLRKDLYPDYFGNRGKAYIDIFINLMKKLIENGDFMCSGGFRSDPLVVGSVHSEWKKIGVIAVNSNETIILEGPFKGWYGADRQEKYWMYDIWKNQLSSIDRFLYSNYYTSEELKELVKNKFKTEEEIRFAKQQFATWASIGVAIMLGILGIIF